VQKCSRLASTGFRDNLAFVGILSTQVWHETFVSAGNPGTAFATADAGGRCSEPPTAEVHP